MTRATIHMIGNAHLDPVWLWQWQEGYQEIKATFRSALDRLNEYEDFIFTSSSAAYYEWVEHNHPAMFKEIQARVAEGRWVLCGGWWIQPDCNLPSGESFVRQGLYAQRYFQEKFGVTATVGYNVDSFGHNGMLPQILQKSGMDYYVFMRPEQHEKELPADLFWWESDDGAQVLTYRLPFAYLAKDEVQDKISAIAARSADASASFGMCFYGVGNHGGGPTKAGIERIQSLQHAAGMPEIRFSSPNAFFAALPEGQDYPVVKGDLQFHAKGCYAAHSGVKLWNRQTEQLLVTAEKLSVVAACVANQPYPARMAEAWKQLLFQQFHDILAGTSLEAAYEDSRDGFGEAKSIAARGLNHAVQALAWSIGIEPEEGMTPIVVFNPHSWAANMPVALEFGHPGLVGEGKLQGEEILTDDEGNEIPLQVVQSLASTDFRNRIAFNAELPALGYRTYRLYRKRPTGVSIEASNQSLQAGDCLLENKRLKLAIDPETGWINSLFDKQYGVEVFQKGAARPCVMEDGSDTWAHGVTAFDRPAGNFGLAKIRLVEFGAVQATIRVESTYGSSVLAQEFTLFSDQDYVEVKVTVDWRERHKLLKLHFPLTFAAETGVYEIPYGHIRRPANGEEVPGLSWFDQTGTLPATGAYGLSILNNGKYSFDMRKGEMNLTVLRSPVYAHHDPIDPAWKLTPERTYTYMDQGVHTFHYILLPHAGTWQEAGTAMRAAELNQRPITLIETYHKGPLAQKLSFASVSAPARGDSQHDGGDSHHDGGDSHHDGGDSLHDGGNSHHDGGDSLHAGGDSHHDGVGRPTGAVQISAMKQAEDGAALIVRCYETDGQATEANISLPVLGRSIQAKFGPCEIKTFLVPLDPALPIKETNLLEWGGWSA